jgi:hypothetical protein
MSWKVFGFVLSDLQDRGFEARNEFGWMVIWVLEI